jgi:hypothetical protein
MAKSRRSWLLPNSHPRDGQQLRTRECEHNGATYGGDEPPAEAYGQVEDFEYDDGETFRLTTYAFHIEFTASRLTITSMPRR